MAEVSFKALVPLFTITSVALLAGCGNANQSAPADEATRAVSCSYPPSGEPAKPVDPPSADDVLNVGETKATLHLATGDIEITMDRSATPCTINSFMSRAQQGWFDETRCHRLTDYGTFTLQCGDPTGTGTGGPGYTIPDELNPRTTGLEREGDTATYPRGIVAMANTGEPNTAGSQFFIVWEDTQLSPEYTVFGTVDEAGLTVVQGIAAQGVDASDGTTPIGEALIRSVTLS